MPYFFIIAHYVKVGQLILIKVLKNLLLFILSAGFVDFVGYWLHRWSHAKWSPLFKPHMTHHVKNYPPKKFTTDKYISSGADSLIIWFAPFGLLYLLTIVIFNIPSPIFVIAGGLLSAIVSAVLHDLSHLNNSIAYKLFPKAVNNHKIHHSHMRKNYGVITDCWDRLFFSKRKEF